MPRATADEINEAIHQCLARCYESEAPLAVIAEFMHQLRAERHWRQRSVYAVEKAVLAILHQLVSEPVEDAAH